MTTPIHGGYTASEVNGLLGEISRIAGLDVTGAVLMRGTTNAVLRLVDPVVVKVARKGTDPDTVLRTVAFVRWLMDLDFPTVHLFRPEIQPLVIDGNAVTLWRYLPQPSHPVPAQAIAKPLNMLHSLHGAPVELPRLDACAAIRASLAHAASLPQESRDFLCSRLNELESALREIRYHLPQAIVQGDPQHRNALFDRDGGAAVLCDWDSVAIGHAEWDLVTVEVHCRRFGHGKRHYQLFAETYGWDVTQWDGYAVLRDLRELRMITTNARKAAHEPAKMAEVLRRIEGLDAGNIYQAWTIL